MSETQDLSATAPPLPAGYEPVFDLGFNAHLGSIYRKLASPDGDPHHYLFDVAPHHLNTGGFTHGGVLMTLADVVLGSTVAHSVGFMCSTISLSCDFLAGAKLGDRIEGSATITREKDDAVPSLLAIVNRWSTD